MKRFIILLIVVMSFLLPAIVSGGETFVIGPEDRLQITVWGNPDLSVHIPVRPDGLISVPLVGDVKAEGMTPAQLKEFLEKEYMKFIKAPTVSVVVTEVNSLKVYIIGGGITAGSGSTGAISLKRNTTLLQLLAQMGTLQNADLKSAYISRSGKKLNVDFMKLITEGDVSQDTELKRDDIIFIPPDLVNRIKVVGAVKSPGMIPYVKGMTALDAVLSAGGFTEFARQNSVEIVRQEGSEVKTIEAKLKDVIKDGDLRQNVYLKPGDMINVKSGIF